MQKMLHNLIREIWRFPLRFYFYLKLKNKNFSLISSNCIGGGYYHDTFQKFLTPTINLTITNFVSFCESIPDIFKEELINGGEDEHGAPIGILGNSKIIGVHYKNFEQLFKDWERRKKE